MDNWLIRMSPSAWTVLRHTVKAGDLVTLSPGESITLPTGCYHEFWGDESRVLVGESLSRK